ncbi:MAG: ATP-binding protein [Candidatus Omnitrophota bacterium]|nr:ATP-binding protein [Candidatus Omnitrophota bacterium]
MLRPQPPVSSEGKQITSARLTVILRKALIIPFFCFVMHEKYGLLCVTLPLWILGDSQKPCTCAPAMVTKYQKRISGPILDRIDIHIEVPRVDYEKLSEDRLGESSESIRKRVQTARDIQNQRYSNIRNSSTESSAVLCNADMRIGEVRQFCQLQPEGQSLMRAAMSQLNLSARAYHRILKLSRTIADLAGSEDIQSAHLAEALQYRPKIMM